MKRAKKVILLCLAALLTLYLIPSIYVSAKVYTIARSTDQSFGENNPYSEVVSDEIYKEMSYRCPPESERGSVEREKDTMWFPITYFWAGEAKTTYWYSYEVFFADGQWAGSWNIPMHVTLRLVDGKRTVTDFYEAA